MIKKYAPSVGPREFIALMALLISIVAISIDAMIPALGAIGTALGATTPNQAQYIITAIFVGMSIGQLICGPASDAIGRKPILFYSTALYLLGSVFCLLSQNLDAMLLGRFLQGLGVSGPYVSCVSIVRDKFHGSQMARIMSLVMMIFIMVPAIAPALGQGVLFFAGWRYIFALYVVYSFTIIAWVGLRLDETLPRVNRIPFNFKNILKGFLTIFKTRSTFFYMLCMGAIFGGLMGYISSAQQIFQNHFAVGKLFPLYFGCLALTFGASSIVNAKLVEKLGMRHICTRAILFNIGISCIFLIINCYLNPPLWMFLTYAALIFFNFGLLFGNLNALAMEPMGHIAGLASAIIGATSSVISISFGTLIGQLYNNTLIPLITGFFIMGLLSFIAFVLAEPRKAADI